MFGLLFGEGRAVERLPRLKRGAVCGDLLGKRGFLQCKRGLELELVAGQCLTRGLVLRHQLNLRLGFLRL